MRDESERTVWLVPTVERFPRSQKFLLGDRIQSTAMDIPEQLVEAAYTRQRRRHRGVHVRGPEPATPRSGRASAERLGMATLRTGFRPSYLGLRGRGGPTGSGRRQPLSVIG